MLTIEAATGLLTDRGKLDLRTPERWQSGRMRRFAKPLYWLIPVPRVRIPPSPPLFQILTDRTCRCYLPLNKRQDKSNDFAMCLLHIRSGRSPIDVHRSSDVRMAHEPLLYADWSTDRIQP